MTSPNLDVSQPLPNAPQQPSLFPIDAKDIYRNDQGSADLKMIATAVNNKDYAVKTTDDGNGFVPLTELFSYELARELSIATPNYALIKLRDQSIGFGSEWEGGALILKESSKVLEVLHGATQVRGLKAFLSRVFALDLFLNNIDRHFGNYIFRDSYSGVIALAYDFSRAWYAFKPFSYESVSEPTTNTFVCHQLILRTNNFDASIAHSTLNEIKHISVEVINRILSNVPGEWMPDDTRNEILGWWGSQDMEDRITLLKSRIH